MTLIKIKEEKYSTVAKQRCLCCVLRVFHLHDFFRLFAKLICILLMMTHSSEIYECIFLTTAHPPTFRKQFGSHLFMFLLNK